MKQVQRLWGVSFVIVLLIMTIFITAQIPVAYQQLENIPVAFVNEDEGPFGEQMATQLTSSDNPSPIQWKMFSSERAMHDAFEVREVYGAIVIPPNYSAELMAKQNGERATPTLYTWTNEGMNPQISMMLTQIFSGMEQMMNGEISQVAMGELEGQMIPFSPQLIQEMTHPITFEHHTAHPVGSLASTPMSLFQPVWLASIISAALLWVISKNTTFHSVKSHWPFRLKQLLFSILLGGTIGFGATYLTAWILDYTYDSSLTVALFTSVAAIAFITLVLATVSWIGIGGIIVFVLLMFFGLPLLQLAPEQLPTFYTDWVIPWLPMRFLIDGLKDILFFNQSVWNKETIVLSVIFIVSSVLILLRPISFTQKEAKKE